MKPLIFRQLSLDYFDTQENFFKKSEFSGKSTVMSDFFLSFLCTFIKFFTLFIWNEHLPCWCFWVVYITLNLNMCASCLCVQIWPSYDSENECEFWPKLCKNLNCLHLRLSCPEAKAKRSVLSLLAWFHLSDHHGSGDTSHTDTGWVETVGAAGDFVEMCENQFQWF